MAETTGIKNTLNDPNLIDKDGNKKPLTYTLGQKIKIVRESDGKDQIYIDDQPSGTFINKK